MIRKMIMGFGIVIFTGHFAGCASVAPEGVDTLIAMGKDEKVKASAAKTDDEIFQKIKSAVKDKRIEKGIPGSEIRHRYGNPVIEDSQDTGKRWVYKPGAGDWFKGPKIYLFFDQANRLGRWECVQLEGVCEPVEVNTASI